MAGDSPRPESDGGADELGKLGADLREQVSRLRERVTHERHRLERRSFSIDPWDDSAEA